jgi:hypothetical protein
MGQAWQRALHFLTHCVCERPAVHRLPGPELTAMIGRPLRLLHWRRVAPTVAVFCEQQAPGYHHAKVQLLHLPKDILGLVGIACIFSPLEEAV